MPRESPWRLNPLTELRAFLRAALVTPVPRDHRDPAPVLRRRRLVSGVTLVVGAVVLWWSLRLPPGDPWFYAWTTVLAGLWVGGAFLSGRLYLGRGHTRAGDYARPVVQSLALGLLLLVVFLGGALLVGQIPWLAGPVNDLLDHVRFASVPIVLVITVMNGVAEEIFFRGALYAAIPQRWTVPATTALYALVTIGSGVPLLVFAAVLLGLVCSLQRRVTGGILGPAITHITWSAGMLLLLPPLLEIVS
ncbi:CPBP family intramembrane glutamic endopeptidase [Serinicoccus kebangsaanensis]|uniref:CPBP family intramembrane glutamic endopeptidase n=1 Tax=Serinicoccus kebangsaanensis TaxID=2602069 RepID=UPI001EE1C83B|nr:type II CAAX endopeptidase family protein [Serinicoccus kebangsaanensis]